MSKNSNTHSESELYILSNTKKKNMKRCNVPLQWKR